MANILWGYCKIKKTAPHPTDDDSACLVIIRVLVSVGSIRIYAPRATTHHMPPPSLRPYVSSLITRAPRYSGKRFKLRGVPDHYLTFITSYERRNLSNRFFPIGFSVWSPIVPDFTNFSSHRTSICDDTQKHYSTLLIFKYFFLCINICILFTLETLCMNN